MLVAALALACGDEAPPDTVAPPPVRPSGHLVAVAAPGPGLAIVAGADGRIHRTVDGGRTWTRGRTPPVDALTALVMPDAEHGWAVGPGTLLRTEDGGARWERQRLPGRADDWPLHAVGAIDAKRAVALANAGRWLTTVDGGALWRAARPELDAEVPAPTELLAVDCEREPLPRCWAVGDRVIAIDPASDVLAARSLADAAGLPAFRFRPGGVEVAEGDAERLHEAGRRLARFSVVWRIEAFVTRDEVRRYAGDQDPSALFDRIEARTGELGGRLEAAGVDAAAIEIAGAPPWGYEDFVDDDPGLLARYWQARLAPVPSALVTATERVTLRAVVATPGGLVAADERGRVFAGEGEVGPLGVVAAPGSHALLALARTANGVVAAGRQGQTFFGAADSGVWQFEPAAAGGGVAFETLRGLAFEPGGLVGWRVGDDGHLARTADGGRTWLRAPSHGSSQEDRPPLR